MKRFIILCISIIISVFQTSKMEAQTTSEDNTSSIKRHREAAKNVQDVAKFFEEKMYVNAKNDTLNYRLLKPLNYDSSKRYPLVVCLSGSGGRGTDNIKQISGCWPSQVLANPENRKDYPCFVFVPQCPPNAIWGNPSYIKNSRFTSIESTVFEAIKTLEDTLPIDSKRRYVTGQSLGGYGTWHYILTHPDMFAAAIPICGGGNPELAHKIIDVPVWAFHGEKDTAVSVTFSRDMITSIKEAGGSPLYTEFENVAHICWPLAYDTPNLLDWLFNQKLNEY